MYWFSNAKETAMDDKEEVYRLICKQKIIKNRSYSREEAIIGIFPLLGRYEEVSANGGLSRYGRCEDALKWANQFIRNTVSS